MVGVLMGPAPGVAAGLVSATVLALTRDGWRRRRRRRDTKAWSECVRALAREVRAGADPLVAVTAVAGTRAGKAMDALAELAAEMRWPGSGAGAAGSSDKSGEPGRMLRAGWGLSRRHGVSWAVLLDALAVDLEDRLRLDRERAAELAGPRLSGVVLALLPGLGLLLGAGMGAHPLHVLLDTPVGGVLLVVGTALTCAGLGWTARIVRT